MFVNLFGIMCLLGLGAFVYYIGGVAEVILNLQGVE